MNKAHYMLFSKPNTLLLPGSYILNLVFIQTNTQFSILIYPFLVYGHHYLCSTKQYSLAKPQLELFAYGMSTFWRNTLTSLLLCTLGSPAVVIAISCSACCKATYIFQFAL